MNLNYKVLAILATLNHSPGILESLHLYGQKYHAVLNLGLA